MRVSDPDRVYTVTLQLEGDIERTINAIFWDPVVKLYDILLAEQDWPPGFVRDCPVGEEVITPSFSPLVLGELAESYSNAWALAQAPALYRNHMAVIKERPLAQGQRIIVISPIPALEAVTKASVPNSKALHPRWIQWATSLTATDVDYKFDPKLQTQEFLQYEMEYPVPAGTLPIDQYQVVMYTDGSAQPAVETKQQYSAACAVVSGSMEGEKFCPQHTYTQTLGDCTAQLAELKALLLALERVDLALFTLIVCDSYY
ncbi:hypothetical protein NDU88_005906 [Pleurodeles waltl]|uniref:RNase H type-1 domain-containing protein n=1 Tax=Pleurodeles waltl TaxID=8319 RepID=A0AAV7QG25_PLEWA|nr:hypothetical protein NDU88_005906 [Pleurodeles waltl]